MTDIDGGMRCSSAVQVDVAARGGDPVLDVLEAVAAYPLSTRQALRDVGVAVDEGALRRAIGRGLVEVHTTAVTLVGEEERFTLTRAGLFASGRNPDDAALLAELEQLERRERALSDRRRAMHARLSTLPNAEPDPGEREVSAERKALHHRIDSLRAELGAAGWDVAAPGPTPQAGHAA
jgi:hypothetical protein